MALNKLDCWWISMNFEQKKEIICKVIDDCVICPLYDSCEKYDRYEDIPEKELEVEEVFKNA